MWSKQFIGLKEMCALHDRGRKGERSVMTRWGYWIVKKNYSQGTATGDWMSPSAKGQWSI